MEEPFNGFMPWMFMQCKTPIITTRLFVWVWVWVCVCGGGGVEKPIIWMVLFYILNRKRNVAQKVQFSMPYIYTMISSICVMTNFWCNGILLLLIVA